MIVTEIKDKTEYDTINQLGKVLGVSKQAIHNVLNNDKYRYYKEKHTYIDKTDNRKTILLDKECVNFIKTYFSSNNWKNETDLQKYEHITSNLTLLYTDILKDTIEEYLKDTWLQTAHDNRARIEQVVKLKKIEEQINKQNEMLEIIIQILCERNKENEN